MTLWQLPAGQRATVIALDDQLDSRYRQRITELGFSVGASVQCILRPGMGAPRQYAINNSVYSLDRQLADAIAIDGGQP
jgi:Fe2+ transport system protein FeoA